MSGVLESDVRFPLSLSCYSREVLFRTCYTYTDRAYIWLEPGADNELVVHLSRKSEKDDLRSVQGEFLNALVDYALRAQVSKETRVVRETLVKAAFAEAIGR